MKEGEIQLGEREVQEEYCPEGNNSQYFPPLYAAYPIIEFEAIFLSPCMRKKLYFIYTVTNQNVLIHQK